MTAKCKGGRIIDDARVNKYEAMCHFMVRKYLPAMALYEASMDYSDLINQCRYEVFRALMNFDPLIAMRSFRMKRVLDQDGNPIVVGVKRGKPVYKMAPDEDKRKREEERKRKNPALALQKAEESIVYGRLNNYVRRVRWKFRPEQRGGKTISADMIMEIPNHEFEVGYSVDPSPMMEMRAILEKEKLLDVLELSGQDAAKEAFDKLPEDVRESILEVIQRNPRATVDLTIEVEDEG